MPLIFSALTVAGWTSSDVTSAQPRAPSASIGWASAPYRPKRRESALACGAAGSAGAASTSTSTRSPSKRRLATDTFHPTTACDSPSAAVVAPYGAGAASSEQATETSPTTESSAISVRTRC